jgi:cytochrome bd-type quinol oxidase subunit 1
MCLRQITSCSRASTLIQLFEDGDDIYTNVLDMNPTKMSAMEASWLG